MHVFLCLNNQEGTTAIELVRELLFFFCISNAKKHFIKYAIKAKSSFIKPLNFSGNSFAIFVIFFKN